jgi:hypothetical protein
METNLSIASKFKQQVELHKAQIISILERVLAVLLIAKKTLSFIQLRGHL